MKSSEPASVVLEPVADAAPRVKKPRVRKSSRRTPDPSILNPRSSILSSYVSIADVIFAVFSIGILLRSRGSMLDDPGLGWHLRNIDAMLAAGGWLWRDPFTLPIADWPWRTNVWLGDLWLWMGWQFAGLEGIAVATAIVWALTIRVIYGMMIRDGLPWPAAAGWTFFAGLATSISWVARPTVFTPLFLLITAWACDRYHRGKCTAGRTLWLVPLFAVWVNTHGGFLAGLATMLVALAVEVALSIGVPHARDLPGARRRAKHLALLVGGCLLATCANPYGWTIYPWLLTLLGNEYFMSINQEWLSPDFHAPNAMRYEMFVLLLPLVLALSKRRPSLTALAISLAWLHAMLSGQRYIVLWVVVTVPLVARLSMHIPWLAERAAKFTARPGVATALAAPAGRRWPVGALVIVLLLAAWAKVSPGFAFISEHRIATTALDDLIARAEGKPIFHHYNWGGYIAWHGWPRVHSWIDDRNEVHGQAHVEEYFDIIEARGTWREKLDKYEFAFVCIPPRKPLAERLADDPAWRVVYRDEFAVTFQREKQASEAITAASARANAVGSGTVAGDAAPPKCD